LEAEVDKQDNISVTQQCDMSGRNIVEEESQRLFKKLEHTLNNNVDDVYFDEPRVFKSLMKVVEVFGGKAEEMENDDFDLVASLKGQNGEYGRLFEQQETVHDAIEEVVKFEHGLSNSVDTMGDVIEKYKKSKDDILLLQQQLLETKSVLTAKQTGSTQLVSLKELWMQKAECEETLRILSELETLKAAPTKVERYLREKKYLNAVLTLNAGIENMFHEDLVSVAGFEDVRIKLMEFKGNILEAIVKQLKDVVFSLNQQGKLNRDDLDDDDRSDTKSLWGNQTVNDFGGGGTMMGTMGGGGGGASFFNNLGTMGLNGSMMLGEEEDTRAVLGRISSAPNVELRNEVLEEISWSMDLEDPGLDAAVEEELDAPEAMGSIFTRLIMKAVSALRAEDDVERMLLNQLSGQFQVVMRSIKDWALMLPRTHAYAPRRGGHAADKGAGADGASAASAAEGKLFVRYVKHLLSCAFFSLRRLVYILRLLSLARKLRDGDENPHAYEMKDSVRKCVLSMWSDVEDMIIAELKRHFVEKDVENITNGMGGPGGPDHGSNSMPGEGGTGHPSAGGSEHDSAVERGEDEEDDDEDGAESRVLICSSTSRLAAPVYREVTAFTERSRELLQSEVDWELGPQTGGKILAAVQIFIDGELMPVILGSINQVMRDLQMNTQYFSLPTADARRVGASAASMTLGRAIGSDASGADGADRDAGDRSSGSTPICLASQMCAKRSKPLFIYWLQLPQHRDAVSTILERMVRGYAASAREEVEAFTWRWLSADAKYKVPVGDAMRQDPLFLVYREHMFDGRSSVEAFTAPPAGAGGGKYPTKKAGGGDGRADGRHDSRQGQGQPPQSQTPGGGGTAGELFAWGPLWEVGNGTSYPASSDKIARDFADISSVAAIAYGCDWLASQLCRGCVSISKKSASQSRGRQAAGRDGSALRYSGGFVVLARRLCASAHVTLFAYWCCVVLYCSHEPRFEFLKQRLLGREQHHLVLDQGRDHGLGAAGGGGSGHPARGGAGGLLLPSAPVFSPEAGHGHLTGARGHNSGAVPALAGLPGRCACGARHGGSGSDILSTVHHHSSTAAALPAAHSALQQRGDRVLQPGQHPLHGRPDPPRQDPHPARYGCVPAVDVHAHRELQVRRAVQQAAAGRDNGGV
jgi:tRNA U34 5-methylaminomethyl-2-thiouridine-forming methyltransferase MnmC